jgi:hypothetical protein
MRPNRSRVKSPSTASANGSVTTWAARIATSFGRKDKGRFLDLGQRLEQRDQHADQEGGEQRRRADLEHHPDRLAREIDNGFLGHATFPAAELRSASA